MKALNLTMQAFGPYKDKVHIDFSKLQNKLFLITGPTGSGKTTILDGISFALFCKSTGARRSFMNMRNAAADEKVATDVCFDFEQSGSKYRFHRSLKWSKNRKTGELKIKELHECLKFNPEIDSWELVASGAESKIRIKAQELLGLNSEQFSQVIVLPQGEFRKLLLSNSNDKLKILQTLFKTERFEKITKSAVDLANDIKKQCELNLSKYELVLSQENVESAEQMKKKYERKQQEHKALNDATEELKKDISDKKTAFSEEQKLSDSFDKLQQLYHKLIDLNCAQAQIEKLKQNFKTLTSLREIYPYVKDYRQTTAELKKETGNYAVSCGKLEIARSKLEAARQAADKKDKLRSEMLKCSSRVDRFEEALKSVNVINDKEQDIESIKIDLQKSEALKIKKESALKCLEEKHEKLSFNLEAIRKSTFDLPQHKLKLNEVRKKQAKYLKLKELTLQVEKLQNSMQITSIQVKNKMQLLAEKQIKLESVRLKEKDNIAASLASNLKSDEPCPVCGSIHHPKLALGEKNVNYSDIISALEIEKSVFERELLEIKTNLAEQKAAFDLKDVLLNEQKKLCLGFSQSEDDVNREADETVKLICEVCENLGLKCRKNEFNEEEKLTDILQWLKQQENIKSSELSKNDKEIAELKKLMEKINQQVSDYKLTIKEKQSSIYALKEQLPESLQKYTSKVLKSSFDKTCDELINRISELESEIKAIDDKLTLAEKNFNISLERMKSTLKNYTELMEKTNTVFAKLKLQLEKQNISMSEIPTVIETHNLDNEIYSIKDKISKHDAEKTLVLKEYQSLKCELEGKSKPELSKLQDEINVADENLNIKIEALGRVKSELNNCQNSLKTIESIEIQDKNLSEKYGKSLKIAELLTGKNPCKIPFKMFALGLMLEDILNCSNNYFSGLSQNRYSFQRKHTYVGGRGFSGLDIEIFDAHFGICRAVETLSGGEMFLASLALSFGLSDVVQNYSGGVHIDSIFIDEGFGSLDEETLNIALNALLMIQESGRTVGLISHVSELKSFIFSKIQVSKRSDGQSDLRIALG